MRKMYEGLFVRAPIEIYPGNYEQNAGSGLQIKASLSQYKKT